MKRITHLVSGAAVGALAFSLGGGSAVGLILLGAFFGIVPDFDLLFQGFGKRVHRSAASHSILAAFIFGVVWIVAVLAEEQLIGTAVLGSVPLWLAAGVVFLSVLVHAAEDSLTLYGCRLLYPISTRVFKGPVRYDDLAANTLLLLFSLAAIALALSADLSSAAG